VLAIVKCAHCEVKQGIFVSNVGRVSVVVALVNHLNSWRRVVHHLKLFLQLPLRLSDSEKKQDD